MGTTVNQGVLGSSPRGGAKATDRIGGFVRCALFTFIFFTPEN